jgi:peptide/nickel transport system permease protein
VQGSLAAYLFRRLGLLVLTVLVVPSLSFTMFTLIQGDVGGPLGLLRELGAYLTATFVHLDVGGDVFNTATYRRTRGALEVVAEGLAPDVQLVFGAVLFGVLAGMAAGTVMAVAARSLHGRALAVATAFILSAPVYWLGFVALILFSPGFGSLVHVPFLSGVGGYRPFTEDPLGWLQAMWLPCVIAGAPLAAACARMAAATLRTVFGDDALRTARAKGATEGRVMRRHAIPLAAPPVIALVGVNMNLLVTNVALMEAVFNIPGSFRFIERALVNRDVDLAQALVVEATVLIVLANFLADAVHAWIDPRAR